VKLLDFGLAKLRGHTNYAAQGIIGTPSFMPPEQALGLPKKMDAQSDVWSLGATLFYALSGQPVHVAKHSRAMVLASASTRPRSLAEAAPELPIAIVEVIDRALAFRKADRWPSIEAMRSAWHDAHPTWLPTLQVPKYAPDPAYLQAVMDRDPSSGPKRVDPERSEIVMSMFDPRKLALDPALQSVALGIEPMPGSRMTPIPSERSTWRKHLALATTALVTTGLVAAAIALSTGDRPAPPRNTSSGAPAGHESPRGD
jgi:serine/threonine-protein kinase